MQRVYRLEGLDCPNCAMKVEHKVGKIQGVEEVHVDFAQKKMFIEMAQALHEQVVTCIQAIEPDVNVVDITKGIHTHDDDHKHHTHKEHTHSCCDHTHEKECSCEHTQEKKERIIAHAMKFKIQGLDCASCAQKVEDAVSKLDNMLDVSLNFTSGILFIKIDKEEMVESVQLRIQKIIDQIEPGVRISLNNEDYVQKKDKHNAQRWEIVRLLLGLIIFGSALVLEGEVYAVWIFLLAYAITGWKVVFTAVRNIFKGEVFDENFLMSIATIGAFVTGSFKEGVAVMIFYAIGELFQSYAVNRSRKSISELMDIRADFAHKIVDGKEVRVIPEDVEVSDHILIRPGERVPLDGILMKGETSLDTSALTGESMPRDVIVGDEILAGSVNINGLIEVRVTKAFHESTVSRILELVENAGSKKAPMEKFITKFARIYTPVVVILALALVVLPMIFIKDAIFYDWLYRALTFLVVSCPCALVVSIPLGLFAGIGGASKKGILIKGGNYLEAISEIDTVVFDKTGTLTKGSFHVETIWALQHTKADLLEIGAYGEAYSNHPIAQSIIKAYGKDIDRSRLRDFEELAGNGVKVFINDEEVLLGNTKLMKTYGIDFEQNTPIGTILHIAKSGSYMGYIVLNDEIKETSAKAIQTLKSIGIKRCIMLSGDRQEVAQAVGEKLQMDEVYAQLLPSDKVDQLEVLLSKQEGKKLAFVGDGINDAPVLARADIGVAMGGIGSDAAIEAADLVLMKDDPLSLAQAILIAKKTKRILWQNIVFSLGVKILVLALTVFGLSTMWMGVFADVGVTLLAVINSMRALKA